MDGSQRDEQVHPNRNLTSRRTRHSESHGDGSRNVCPICLNDLQDIAAYQACSHVLCFDCSVRNRVLCDKRTCPVCRTESKEIVLTGHRLIDGEDPGSHFKRILETCRGRGDPYYGFVFENVGIERAYRKILTHSCRLCDRKFDNFDELVRHCRERHEMYYCNVCVRSLTLFTWEHKLYSYDELLRHMDEGDVTDKNKTPPHPQCQLCNFRSYDNDDLFKHSKLRHHLCWICERSFNKIVFFGNFPDLTEHMIDHHYVCKKCSKPEEARLTAFPDEESLHLHNATDHSDGSIRPDMLFNFQPRREQRGKQGRGQPAADAENVENMRPPSPVSQRFNMDRAQFPALSSAESTTIASGSGDSRRRPFSSLMDQPEGERTASERPTPKASYAAPKMTEDNFPTLGPAPSSSGVPHVASWGNVVKAVPSETGKKTKNKDKVHVSQTQARAPPASARDAFPALAAPSKPRIAPEWVTVSPKAKSKPPTSIAEHKQMQASVNGGDSSARKKPIGMPELDSSESFPSLSSPSGNSLPGFGPKDPFSKSSKAKSQPVAKAEKANKQKSSESESIAKAMFSTPLITSSGITVTDGPVVSPPPPVPRMPQKPFSMRKDDFPTLDIGAPAEKQKLGLDNVVKQDRLKLQKEVKSQWGGTVIQYETVFKFIPPSRMEERMTDLRSKIQPIEVQGKVKDLDDFVRELLSRQITPLEFWMECRRLLGKKFHQRMPEVIVLLPDIAMGKELFEVAKTPIYGDQSVIKNLMSCSVCGQVVSNDDKQTHMKVHK